MATSRIRCLSILRKKFLGKKFPQKNIIVIHHNTSITSNEEDNSSSCVEVEEIANLKDDQCSLGSAASRSEDAGTAADATAAPSDNREPSAEESAAIKIQAIFRGHLARRAFRALKSLVKLQAVARGVCVRRQARMALNCMHALVRLQVRVRARHLLSTRSDD